MLLLLLSHFSRVWLFATPWTVACQAPLSTEFSRQEYWSGLPFPSPGDLPNPGAEPRSPTLQVDSWPAEPQGQSKNTGVGSRSLLQGIFLTQESNQGLLHCRWILYQVYWQCCVNFRVRVSAQWSDSVLYTRVSTFFNFFKILFPDTPFRSIE